MSLDAAAATRAPEGVKYRRACRRPRMKAAPRMERALQELAPVQQHRAPERERMWPLSAPLLLEVRITDPLSPSPRSGGPSVRPGNGGPTIVEVLEASEKRLRVRFMGGTRPVAWISRDRVSGVIVNGRVRRDDVEIPLEAALAVRGLTGDETGEIRRRYAEKPRVAAVDGVWVKCPERLCDTIIQVNVEPPHISVRGAFRRSARGHLLQVHGIRRRRLSLWADECTRQAYANRRLRRAADDAA